MRQARERIGSHLEISAGALAAVAGLYYMDDSGITVWVLLSALLHELGHCLAIHLLGGRVTRLRLTLRGAELRLSAARPLSHGRMILAALAGPGVNLLLAVTGAALAHRGAGERLYFFAGLNLGLCCFNLLPVSWLDGGRALQSGMAWLGLSELGEALTDIFSKTTALLLLLAGALLLWQSEGRNFTLFAAGLWIAGSTFLSERISWRSGRPNFS